MRPRHTPAKTYSHLVAQRRMPGDYDLATTLLHHHLTCGFEVDVPAARWQRRHQAESAFRATDWGQFRDPCETTYARYAARQAEREATREALCRMADALGADDRLDPAWLDVVSRLVSPLRFVWHGFQMVAAYVGHLAPDSRLTGISLLQAADELRRIDGVAFRLAQLRRLRPGMGGDGRQLWEQDPAWQALRRCVEMALVTWDWGEAFVALNVCLKPVTDLLVMRQLAALGKARGDEVLSGMLFSFDEDARWQRDWTLALLRLACEQCPGSREAVAGWTRVWLPRAYEAVGVMVGPLGNDAVLWLPAVRAAIEDWLAPVGGLPA